MAEFIEIMRVKDRICIGRRCGDCPLKKESNGHIILCDDLMDEHPEEFERICLDWAKENPEVTNSDKLYQIVKEAFGEEMTNRLKNLYTASTTKNCDYIDCPTDCDCTNCEYHNFWNKPYVEPKGEE